MSVVVVVSVAVVVSSWLIVVVALLCRLSLIVVSLVVIDCCFVACCSFCCCWNTDSAPGDSTVPVKQQSIADNGGQGGVYRRQTRYRIKVITLCSKVWLKQSERTSEQRSRFFRLQILWPVEVRGGRVVDSVAFG